MRVLFATLMVFGLASAAPAQRVGPPPRPPMASPTAPPERTRSNLSAEEQIVVTGIANGARVVEVDFDKVWKNCAECKRALAKLDKLAQAYRDEQNVAREFAVSASKCGGASPSSAMTFSGSSAEEVGGGTRRTLKEVGDQLCAARAEDQSRRTYAAMGEKYVVPERSKLLGYMRSFLDQLAPHLREATEAERIANNASAGLTDKKRTKIAAKRLTRIDVTRAVIARLDAKPFTIDLPDPPKPGPAAGGYEPPKGKRK